MNQFDSHKDYYKILGASEGATPRDLERLYKRMAARRHPDKGGSEEEMKSLNEAYSVLKDKEARLEYDAQRAKPAARFVPVSAPAAQDVGIMGQGLSAFFCLLIGLFFLLLVRFQGIWFLWPLGVLALAVILFGVMMARNAMRAINDSLPLSSRLRRYTGLQELIFWSFVGGGVYGVYLLMTAM